MAEQKIEGGATLWARKTIESDIFLWKPEIWFKIWFYVVNTVNWKDGKRLKRGQGYFKYEWIMNATGATRSTVDHCFRYLKKEQMCATQKATRGMVVTVLNYDRYQDIDTYRSDTKSDLKAIQKRYRSDTISKEREIREEREEEYNPAFELFWKHYPRKKEKDDAFITWKQLNKTQQKEVTTAAENYSTEVQILKTEEQYIKHAKTFINPKKKRWKDYLPGSWSPPLGPDPRAPKASREKTGKQQIYETARKEEEDRLFAELSLVHKGEELELAIKKGLAIFSQKFWREKEDPY